jgi:hypothetical protein
MKTVTFIEQTVELAAVTFKFGALVEHFAKGILNYLDLFADTNFSTQSLLVLRRSRQMVGMGVGLKDPLHIKPLGFHPGDDLIGGFGVCLA